LTKLTKTFILLGLLGIVLLSCASMTNQNNANKEQVQPSNEPVMVEQLSSDILLAEHEAARVSITGVQQDTETIAPITVHIDGEQKTYQWQNVADVEYYPELVVTDLNADGQDEIYLFLTKGYGTGVVDTQIHILRKNFTEFTPPNPFVDLKGKLTSTVDENDSEQIYTLQLNKRAYTYTYQHDEAAMWFEEIVVGKSTTYRIEQNELILSLSLQVAPTITVGTLEMNYKLIDNQFKLSSMRLV